MFRALNLRRSLRQSLLHHHHHHQNPLSHPLKTLSSSTAPQNPNLTLPFCSTSTSPSPPPPPPPLASSSSSTEAEIRKYLGYSALLIGCGIATYYSFPFPENAKHKKAQLFRYAPLPEDLHTVSNWSGTHEVQTRVFLQPESLQELETIVRDANEKKQKIRPVGSGLSPNGIGLTRLGMVNLALMDRFWRWIRRRRQFGSRPVSGFSSLLMGSKITVSLCRILPRFGSSRLGVLFRKLLSENKHVKYLYIPYTDTVVVVTCNPVSKWKGPPKFKPKYSRDEAIQPLRDLYQESLKKYRGEGIAAKSLDNNEPDINELSFTELRDKLLALDPLNKDHVIKVNQAEAEFWRKSEGYRVGWSDEILGFDCGGQQWVSETCFPAGTLLKPSMKDLEYIEKLMQLIDKEEMPAPAPIEQRWTAHSRSPMSPASSEAEEDIFSWVGIIMYLPTADARQRKEITEEFFHYRRLTQTQLWDQYSAYEHWAKIEVPKDKEELAALQARLRKRFPVDAYNKARNDMDPNRILSNNMLEKLFPESDTI